jgi:hypothetical protein
MGFEFEFDAKNNVLRGTIKDRPKGLRLVDEIMKLLIKRQTSLADGSEALTTVMLNALKANYGCEKANEFEMLLSHYSEEVRKLSESMKRDRFSSISNKRFAEWIERDRVSMDKQSKPGITKASFRFSETALAPYRASTGERGHQPAE